MSPADLSRLERPLPWSCSWFGFICLCRIKMVIHNLILFQSGQSIIHFNSLEGAVVLRKFVVKIYQVYRRRYDDFTMTTTVTFSLSVRI